MVDRNSLKILIVDDNRDVCDVVVELFRATGMNVRGVYSAQDALKIIYREEISIVITDVNMPGEDGFYLLKKIKEFDQDFPKVLFFSGEPADLQLCYQMGVEGFFEKPFDINEVKRTIMRCFLSKRDWLRHPVNRSTGRIFKKFYDWDQLVSSRQIAFGKSGLFIKERDPFLKVNDVCDFKIQFVSGSPIKKIEGQGIIRWIRKPGESTLPPGIGLEVIHIHRDSMLFFLRQLDKTEGIATIPKVA